MKPVSKRTQNRVRREEAKGAELARLRKEVNQLKKQLARLRREMERLEFFVPDDAESELAPLVDKPGPTEPMCLQCKSTNITKITLLSGKILVLCKNCRTTTSETQ
jgi:predicted RNase H-like nuclease (RuvC/YqgF family)